MGGRVAYDKLAEREVERTSHLQDSRKNLSKQVRQTREQLTSTYTAVRSFDYELMRLFAQARINASLSLIFMGIAAGMIAAVVSSGLDLAVAGVIIVLLTHLAMVTFCRRFLAMPPDQVKTGSWYKRFVFLDLLTGISWVFALSTFTRSDGLLADTFALIGMLIIVAVWSLVASTIPAAFFAVTIPVAMAMIGYLAPKGGVENAILTAMQVALLSFSSSCQTGYLGHVWQP